MLRAWPTSCRHGELQGQDGLYDVGDAGSAATEFVQEPPALEGGVGLLADGSDPGVGGVHGPLPCRKRTPAASVGHADRAPGSLVTLVGPGPDAGLGQCVDDAVEAGGLDAVDGAWQGRRGPEQPPNGSVMTWTFIPRRLCLPEYYGRSVATRSMDNRVPSRMTNALVPAVPQLGLPEGPFADCSETSHAEDSAHVSRSALSTRP